MTRRTDSPADILFSMECGHVLTGRNSGQIAEAWRAGWTSQLRLWCPVHHWVEIVDVVDGW